MTRRGSVRKRWDKPGRPWYVVCVCQPGKLYRLGPANTDLQRAMSKATDIGWTYSPERGWECPDCIRRLVDAQLEMALAKRHVPAPARKKEREK